MNSPSNKQSPSTELTGGAGFSFEDTVVAYYLASLLRHERAAGQDGIVSSVAVQQQGHGNPMDDLLVEFDDAGAKRTSGLQIKRSLTISAAESNKDFREIVSAAIATQNATAFRIDADATGFVVESAAVAPLQSLIRLIQWAKASPNAEDFGARFASGGAAAAAERALRTELAALIGSTSLEDEVRFYRHLIALQLNGLSEGGALRADVQNRLQELVVANEDGQDLLLFDRLCRIARDGAATAAKWTLTAAPSYRSRHDNDRRNRPNTRRGGVGLVVKLAS